MITRPRVSGMGRMTATIIGRARGHLGAAIGKSRASDNQIIMDHVKAAHEILSATQPHIHHAGTIIGEHIDECALCGCDIRDPIHARIEDEES